MHLPSPKKHLKGIRLFFLTRPGSDALAARQTFCFGWHGAPSAIFSARCSVPAQRTRHARRPYRVSQGQGYRSEGRDLGKSGAAVVQSGRCRRPMRTRGAARGEGLVGGIVGNVAAKPRRCAGAACCFWEMVAVCA